jgi:phosphocarrier protein HPr
MLLYSCGKENRRKRNKQEKTTHTFIDMKREVIIMTKTTVFLQAINDVKEFVNIVMKYDFDIDLVSGRYAIDAKSIMGIFSLDLSKPIQLNAHTDDAEDLLKDLNKFIVK